MSGYQYLGGSSDVDHVDCLSISEVERGDGLEQRAIEMNSWSGLLSHGGRINAVGERDGNGNHHNKGSSSICKSSSSSSGSGNRLNSSNIVGGDGGNGCQEEEEEQQQQQQQRVLQQNLWKSRKIRLVAAFAGISLSLIAVIWLFATQFMSTKVALSRLTPYKAVTHPEVPSPLWGVVQKPFPTGAFWTNLVVKNGDGAIALHPYGIKCTDLGVGVSYGPTRRSVSNMAISDPYVTDLQISSLQGYVSRGIEAYDAVSVTMGFNTVGGGKFRAPLVKGAPFVTVVFDNATPIISSALMKIIAVDARVVKNLAGVQYIVTLGNYQKWLVYCSEPVALVWKDNALSSNSPIRGFIRVAILPPQNFEAAALILMQYVQKYPTGGSAVLSYPSPTTSLSTMQFLSQGPGPLLMFALPHQIAVMTGGLADSTESKAAQAAISPVYCIKGKLKAIVGDVWRLQYTLASVGWNYALPNRVDSTQLDSIGLQLLSDVKSVLPTAVDPYSFGKELARMARLALIADYLGIAEARVQAVANIENAILPWILGQNPDSLVYDKTWGGLITSNGLADPYADYGNGWYSDHHFHYGYFIYAAATLARLDGPFFEANRPALEAFVRDVCNYDSTDPDFPIARHKDFFDGHSWASGLYQQANGKGQESISESVNAYYASYLFALATANEDLKKFALVMLTTEVHAGSFYWHMVNDEIYDGVFAASRMVGNVGALDVTASTWFGSELEYVHGINMMPITPATGLLLDQPFVQLQYPLLAARLPAPVSSAQQQCSANSGCSSIGMIGLCCPTADGAMLACCDPGPQGQTRMQDEWKSLIYIDHAVVDRDAARSQILTVGGFGPGNSKCNSLLWAASRPTPPPAGSWDSTPHSPEFSKSIKSSCAANSACDAAGITGECCPTLFTSNTAPSVMLGCCPKIS